MNQQPLNRPPASLERLSRLMDSSIPLPGGYRIGWDGIIGLIPGVGDLAGLGISVYILIGAHNAGASTATLLRMILNVIVETVVGAIPLIGDIFDFAFKANNRNMSLLRQQLADPSAVRVQSQQRVWLAVAIMLLSVALIVYVMVKLVAAAISILF